MMICSDGLSGMVRSEDISGVLTELEDPVEACAKLIALANEAGGHDNVTVVIVKFVGAGLSEPSEGDPAVCYQKYSFSDTEGAPAEEDSGPPERAEFRDTAKLPRRGDSQPPESGATAPSSSGDGPSLLAKAAPIAGSEDSVAVPLAGWPPGAVGAIIMAGVTLIIVMGFYLLR
jgi:protein phosphatase